MRFNLTELARLSARLGRDRYRVQGAGGNTSAKIDDVMWVKASGKWLARAEDEMIFVPIDLPRLRRQMSAGMPDPVADTLLAGLAPQGLRPSIETTLHGALPHRVVLHTHSVAVIAHAVRRDAEAVLAPRLSGLNWILVPYVRPGTPLADAIMAATAGRRCDVLVLANHGLVVGGDDYDDAAATMEEVERRLAVTARTLTAKVDTDRLAELAKGSPYRLSEDPGNHAIARDPISLQTGQMGSLYPDHVVFLGPGLTVIDSGRPVATYTDLLAAPPALLVVRGLGVLVRNDLPAAATCMVGCLADVLARIPAGVPIRSLGRSDEAALMNWDAEHARQSLNR